MSTLTIRLPLQNRMARMLGPGTEEKMTKPE